MRYNVRVDVGIYFLRSKTKTVPSLAEAPTCKTNDETSVLNFIMIFLTLSPRLFQQTSKIPPVPL